MKRIWSLRVAAAAAVVAALGAGCARSPGRGAGRSPALAAEGYVDPGRFQALLVSGGGWPEINYQSHLLHLRALTDVLVDGGVPRERISILAGDGADPAPDLAVRAVQPETGFWMIDGTPLEPLLRTPTQLASSTVPGIRLEPATRPSLERWFAQARRTLRPGDTLLLYVTDHGTRDPRNPRNSRITLWGRNASLDVNELGTLLSSLDPRVRVVTLMSQCYSGAFARLAEERRGTREGGGFCGYFSTTADRPAHGCYPENLGKDNVGFSFHFLEELRQNRPFPAAHRALEVTDRTPDVPLRTSDLFLQDLLARAAARSGRPVAQVADELLAEAWKDGQRWEADLRLLDEVGQTFGIWSPRSLAELDAHAGDLPDFTEKMNVLKQVWSDGLGDMNVARLNRWLEQHPEWKERVGQRQVVALSQAQRRALAAELVKALEGFELDRSRLAVAHERAESAQALSYRLEVRQGALLRLRALLTGIAGRVYLATQGTEEERRRYGDLLACEDLRLPPGASKPPPPREPPPPLPPFRDDGALAERLPPAFIGVHFQQTQEDMQRKYGLPAGASQVTGVVKESPAEQAGLRPGDVILGPQGAPFTEHNQLRTWTFFSEPGKAQRLEVLRDEKRIEVSLVPRLHDGHPPKLPEPPPLESPAPALSVAPYRGKPPATLADGSPHLLFFWATYCGPCKASLPEVLAFGRQMNVPVVAITDEPKDTVDAFFAKWKQPFPETVALDKFRSSHIAYAVSGVPTFVYVDGEGKIQSRWTGYGGPKGINVPGWHYSPPAK
jgi:thiol-disulfide isomerase/thioredoxin